MTAQSRPEPTRIAQVVGKVILGGVDSVVMNYYRHIDRTKIQFDFIMDGLEKSSVDDEIISLGGRIYKLPPYDEDMGANLREFRKIVNLNSYKIIHCHMNTLSVFWLREAKRAGIPVRIAHSHSTAHWGEGKRTVMKYMLRPFSRVYPTHYFACSEYAGRWLFGNNFFNDGKGYIMHNAIDIEKFAYSPEVRDRVRKALNIQDKFVVGHVGRFVYQKNHSFLIKVFQLVYRENPNAVLILVGNGKLKEKTEKLVENLGLKGSVLFLGARHDVNELYQAMDVFVLPSHYEGLPVVAVEAQSAGLPCVLSDAVTKEVAVTQRVKMLSLDLAPETWASVVLEEAAGEHVCGGAENIAAGYEIVREAERLGAWYGECKNTCK